MARTYRNPVYPGYFADPFVVPTAEGYVAVGTGRVVDGRVFEVLRSPDLVHWEHAGGALDPLPAGSPTSSATTTGRRRSRRSRADGGCTTPWVATTPATRCGSPSPTTPPARTRTAAST